MLGLKDLGASYGYGDIIKDISLQVRPGEVCAILGANGAGKTTLLRAIMGYLSISGGTIAGPGNTPIVGMSPHRIARLGLAYVPEGRGIFFSLTVLENLLVGATPLRMRHDAGADARLEALLARFPILRERLHQPAGLLSGGQQQMLAIARALMAGPRVLLLDEPSLGLAPLVRKEIAALLVSIKQTDGLAVLLVEQDVKLAQRCADFAHVLRRGHLMARMEVAELADRDQLRDAYLGRSSATAPLPHASYDTLPH